MGNELSGENKTLSSSEIEALLSSEYNKNQPVTFLGQPFIATTLSVPKTSGNTPYIISLTETKDPNKVIIYKAVIAAYNYVYFDKEAALSAKIEFGRCAKCFIEWLNNYNIENRYEILKHYETARMDELNNHGGYSPLLSLKQLLKYAIESEHLSKELSSDDYAFLIELKKTKHSPNINKSQKSIASYFGALDWLRRKDIGIGNELYSTLASPRLAISSLSLSAATVIIELNAYKEELRAWLKSIESDLTPWIEISFSKLGNAKKQKAIGNIIYQIISAYHHSKSTSNKLKTALAALLLSNASNEESYASLQTALESQDDCDSLFLKSTRNNKSLNAAFCQKHFTIHFNGNLFSLKMVKALLADKNSETLTVIEEVMFTWLMASLTVQPYDIPKLTLSSFRKMIVGGRVTHIECEYFKGRAKVFHTTRSLSTRTPEGKAIQIFLNQHSEGGALGTSRTLNISSGINSFTGRFRLLLQLSGMDTSLQALHTKKNYLS